MENKIINAIKYIKFVTKKRHGEGTWETAEGLMTSLSNMVINNLLEVTDSTYKVKETDCVEETQITKSKASIL